ncbi:MAG: hypothetical protein JNN15_06625 [Blastocatellia bacterium]|nr:hypothetical protein [Blastocatellia bacterium]
MSVGSEQLIEKMDLGNFFDETKLSYDLREGVVWNVSKTRICLLSTDLLLGVYKALVDEAGPAWKLILKNCGLIWGDRVAKRLDRECSLILGKKLGDLVLSHFLSFTTDYFLFHGWGRLNLDVSKAEQNGIVEASLENSVFASIIEDSEEMVDPMIAGILASILSYMSGQKLDCIQTACVTKGAPISRFIITGTDRLKDGEAKVKAGMTHEQLVETV